MAVSKQHALDMAERRAKVLDLFQRGLKQHEIVKELDLPPMTVSRDLAASDPSVRALATQFFTRRAAGGVALLSLRRPH